MTLGTSPHPRGNPSKRWAAAERTMAGACARLQAWTECWRNSATGARSLASTAAACYLAALAVLAITAWHDPAAGGMLSVVPGWHLAFLMATGTGVALLTLARRDGDAGEGLDSEDPLASTAGLGELMAQLSHELRTPLNAVIGFSELMVRELHGPLGNARYQEYAHHISESGGRLLRSSEEALSVTEALSALMADRRGARRERRVVALLVRDAWRAATSPPGDAAPRLVLTTCASCDLTCERRPTVKALEHLLQEASGYAGKAGVITVTGRRQGARRSVEIRAQRGAAPAANSGLGVILARLLLEMQGAMLSCTADAEAWTARVEFPQRGKRQPRQWPQWGAGGSPA
jgi:hypothetical protein